jgi:hypothetical protein
MSLGRDGMNIKTTPPIIDGTEAVLLIRHNTDDGYLEMSGATPLTVDNAVITDSAQIIARDPFMMGIDTLPEGWMASRKTENDPWRLEPAPSS